MLLLELHHLVLLVVQGIEVRAEDGLGLVQKTRLRSMVRHHTRRSSRYQRVRQPATIAAEQKAAKRVALLGLGGAPRACTLLVHGRTVYLTTELGLPIPIRAPAVLVRVVPALYSRSLAPATKERKAALLGDKIVPAVLDRLSPCTKLARSSTEGIEGSAGIARRGLRGVEARPTWRSNNRE